MRRIVLLCLFTVSVINCQNYGRLEIVHSLPMLLNEISGFESVPGSHILWAVNDSGNSSEIYGYNPITGKIEESMKLLNVVNVDWEDVTSDPKGNLYIGDFGNNDNHRSDLTIYKIKMATERFGLSAELITFEYEDQIDFPPKRSKHNFDVEAFIYFENHFYLFTRNRSSKFDGTSKLYKVPATPGHHIAKLHGSFVTCKDRKDCQVTAASMNKAATKMAILSYDKVWVFTEFEGDDFLSAKVEKINLKHRSQKESLSFMNDSTLYIADELNGSEGGNLYTLTINQ